MVNTATAPTTEPPTTAIVPMPDNAIETMAAIRFRIPGDVIAAATKELPDAQRTIIRWFAGYCRGRNLDREAIGALLKKKSGTAYSFDSVYQVFTGRRSEQGADLAPICEAMENFRKQIESNVRIGDSGFIRTRLAQAQWDRCDRARERRRIAFIFGDSQIGKSTALVQYQQDHNHGETIYVEAPSGGSVTNFTKLLAGKLAIATSHTQHMQEAIINSFDPKMLLIVDEAHRFLHAWRGIHALDFLRELYNRAGCGIVIAMTNEGRDLFRTGNFSKRLQQLWRRRIAPLQLPQAVPTDDLVLFAAAYGLAAAQDEEVVVRTNFFDTNGKEKSKEMRASPLALQTRVIAEEGLGVWLTILQDAADLAKTQKRPVSWAAVIKAHAMMQADSEVWE